jgi:hypothetical protein
MFLHGHDGGEGSRRPTAMADISTDNGGAHGSAPSRSGGMFLHGHGGGEGSRRPTTMEDISTDNGGAHGGAPSRSGGMFLHVHGGGEGSRRPTTMEDISTDNGGGEGSLRLQRVNVGSVRGVRGMFGGRNRVLPDKRKQASIMSTMRDTIAFYHSMLCLNLQKAVLR